MDDFGWPVWAESLGMASRSEQDHDGDIKHMASTKQPSHLNENDSQVGNSIALEPSLRWVMMMACPWQVWADPLGVASKPEQGLAQRQSQQEWQGHTATAWQIDPQLALALVDRFPTSQPIQAALQALVTSGARAMATQVPLQPLPLQI